MSTFSGPQHRGAMRKHRENKRLQFEVRNVLTPGERRRSARRKK